VVYESVGGDTFITCLDNLAIRGKLVLIGFVSGYESEAGGSPVKLSTPALVSKLLTRSMSLRGFMLFTYKECLGEYMGKLAKMLGEGKIKSAVDLGSEGGTFKGLEGVEKAVGYMFDKKNVGKVVVDLSDMSGNL